MSSGGSEIAKNVVIRRRPDRLKTSLENVIWLEKQSTVCIERRLDMLKTIRVLLIALIGMGISSVAAAQGFEPSKMFFGGGISSNEMSDSDSATGWQVFGGYSFGEVTRNIIIDAEVGYMDTGSMDRPGRGSVKANGLWATGVARLIVTPTIEVLGRVGADFGDDDGLMAGIGVGFNLTKSFKLRFEYVQRENTDSIQLNLVFQP